MTDMGFFLLTFGAAIALLAYCVRRAVLALDACFENAQREVER